MCVLRQNLNFGRRILSMSLTVVSIRDIGRISQLPAVFGRGLMWIRSNCPNPHGEPWGERDANIRSKTTGPFSQTATEECCVEMI